MFSFSRFFLLDESKKDVTFSFFDKLLTSEREEIERYIHPEDQVGMSLARFCLKYREFSNLLSRRFGEDALEQLRLASGDVEFLFLPWPSKIEKKDLLLNRFEGGVSTETIYPSLGNLEDTIGTKAVVHDLDEGSFYRIREVSPTEN